MDGVDHRERPTGRRGRPRPLWRLPVERPEGRAPGCSSLSRGAAPASWTRGTDWKPVVTNQQTGAKQLHQKDANGRSKQDGEVRSAELGLRAGDRDDGVGRIDPGPPLLSTPVSMGGRRSGILGSKPNQHWTGFDPSRTLTRMAQILLSSHWFVNRRWKRMAVSRRSDGRRDFRRSAACPT